MSIALIHYWLTGMRGGERVLAEFCRMFPAARLYTHAFCPDRVDAAIGQMAVQETCVARLPGGRRHPQWYLPLMPHALRRLDLRAHDFILSSESGPAKGVRKRPDAVHVCYCHTPMRYVWDLRDDYLRQAGLAGRCAMRLFTPGLRRYDLASAEGVDHFVANSEFVAGRLRRIYGREAAVIHPPVDVERFAPAGAPPPPERDYYLFVGAGAAYKRPDIAVEACLRLGRRLVLAGSAARGAKWRKRIGADPRITFKGFVPEAEMPALYANARALLFPGIEDFGMAPVEAMASGTPVVAFRAGGALETVVDGATGIFFREQSAESLAHALEDFEGGGRVWRPDALRRHALRFGAERFRREMREFLAPRVRLPELAVDA